MRREDMRFLVPLLFAAALAACATTSKPSATPNADFDARYLPPDKRGNMPEPSGISPAGPEYR